MIVAFMGVGGSGKTTNAKLFYRMLKKANIDVEYRTEFDYVLLKPITKLIEKKMPSVRTQFTEISSKKKPSYFKLWPFIMWLDFLLLWISIKFNSKKVYVFDRYIHDFLPAWEFLGYNNKIMRLLYLKFPVPDIAFYIDVDPTIAVDRKYGEVLSPSYQQEIVKFYDRVGQYYLWLIKYLHIPKIYSEPTIKETFAQIINHIQKNPSKNSSIDNLIKKIRSASSLKILFFLRWAGVRYGGGETHVIELASRMAEKGHDVHILTREGKRIKDFDKKITIWRVPTNWNESDHSYPSSDIRLYIHTLFFLFKSLIKIIQLKKKGINYDVVSIHHISESLLIRPLRKFLRWPYIFFLDGYTDLEAREARHANLQIAISQTIINKCFTKYKYKPLLGLVGTDVNKFTEKGKRISFEHGKTVIFTVSRLASQKNLHIYIEAAKLVCNKNPKFLFLIGGEGPEKNRLNKLIKDNNLHNQVILLGGISQENLPIYYRSVDMFVTTEFPPDETLITVIEAMSSGTPVIGTSPTGRFEIIGESGEIVPFGRPDLLADKIIEVSNNFKLRQRMIQKGLEKSKQYDWNKIINIYEQACKTVVKSKS